MRELIDTLRLTQCSCVIAAADGRTVVCRGRGVSDLYRIYTSEPALLRGASIADKVVGKGAAAIMVCGSVKAVHAITISQAALTLLEEAGIQTTCDRCVPHIINRAGTDLCPVERRCMPCHTAAECLPHIARFIASQPSGSNWSVPTPQSGHTQSDGRSSNGVPGSMPFSGSPTAGS